MSTLSANSDTDYLLWKATKKFRRAPISPLPPPQVDGKWVRDDTEKVEHYAIHLQQVFSPHEMPTIPLPALDKLAQYHFSFSPSAVAHTVDILNVRTAPGADRITGRMLSELPKTGILWLTRLYNAYFDLESFPRHGDKPKLLCCISVVKIQRRCHPIGQSHCCRHSAKPLRNFSAKKY